MFRKLFAETQTGKHSNNNFPLNYVIIIRPNSLFFIRVFDSFFFQSFDCMRTICGITNSLLIILVQYPAALWEMCSPETHCELILMSQKKHGRL